MDLDRSDLGADDYSMTALQIFDYCGADRTGKLRVDALMDKFAPFVKTNKAEYSYLKSLLDPDEDNPEISVSMLAKTLHKYSENQKSKTDLDESFNLKSGQAPQDSDSGISTDGFQLLEELQCELREKAHLAHKLRSQLDFTDRQHEEALAALTAERDSLRVHLNMLREENMTLTHVRRDYDEACERLCSSERALDEVRRELDTLRRRNKITVEQVAILENEKLTLQELLSKSKTECHRMNEMYASRQSTLLEQNEALRAEHADLATRLQDQADFVQQMIKEKVLLEMELKDLLNKSCQPPAVMDRSIDISYTEEQMLTALDTLNTDSRFSQENRILDEESFINALKEDQGRSTNMSLFDEIRLSFCNLSRHNMTDFNIQEKLLDNSFITIGTQTDSDPCSCDTEVQIPSAQCYEQCNCDTNVIGTQTDFGHYSCSIKVQFTQTDSTSYCYTETQTDFEVYNNACNDQNTIGTQTEDTVISNNNNTQTNSCLECEKISRYTKKLERDVNMSHRSVVEMQSEIEKYEDNLNTLQQFVDEGKDRNNLLQDIIKSLEHKICLLEAACEKQNDRLDSLLPNCCVDTQTECDITSTGTQVDIPCVECENRKTVVPHRTLRRFFWDPIKCLFQIFAVVCFLCAISVLYGVSQRGIHAPCRDPVPWRWMDAQEFMDLLLRIEYVADVPM